MNSLQYVNAKMQNNHTFFLFFLSVCPLSTLILIGPLRKNKVHKVISYLYSKVFGRSFFPYLSCLIWQSVFRIITSPRQSSAQGVRVGCGEIRLQSSLSSRFPGFFWAKYLIIPHLGVWGKRRKKKQQLDCNQSF